MIKLGQEKKKTSAGGKGHSIKKLTRNAQATIILKHKNALGCTQIGENLCCKMNDNWVKKFKMSRTILRTVKVKHF